MRKLLTGSIAKIPANSQYLHAGALPHIHKKKDVWLSEYFGMFLYSPAMWMQRRNLKFEIPTHLITRKSTRASGPGGQSVNKADTKVQLSFNLGKAHWIPMEVQESLQ
ncbi:hypothetical protein IE077_002942 [Cardiosporidium cionae]|uniref:Prokaryotic-type class I peptide chain release factors domain-containing protein n=1 Tax=Cardiosporidium cionae TaxID=476202 RepID=A0ABQ7JFA8_9APIC|nr:hypothetical protein IE077_002942 [Cardiosporidium cionae]|eukprot:KAF8822706.1 hypothetical protein IE077_002942 [Cardiosporidium cionae]